MANGMNRRDFLTTVGVAGAGAVAAGALGGIKPARAQSGMLGTVSVLKKGGLTVHTYMAPDASVLVTSHIIETANSLIVVDTQFLQTFAKDAKAYVDSLGKKIDRVILSHQHPDHWSGANFYAGVPFITTEAVVAGVKADIDGGGVQARAGLVGAAEVPAEPRAPEAGITAGDLTIDGVTLNIQIVKDAEAPEQLVIGLPQARTLIVQDLVYNGAYFFPRPASLPGWVTALEALRTQKADYDILLNGHGLPSGIGAVDNALEYLKFMGETFATAKTAEDATAAFVARYPAYSGSFILSFIAQVYQSR